MHLSNVKMVRENYFQECLDLLFQARGSDVEPFDYRWHIYSGRDWWVIFSKMHFLGMMILAIVMSVRRALNRLTISKYLNTYVVDCKDAIHKDLLKAKIIGENAISNNVYLTYQILPVIFQTIVLIKREYKLRPYKCVEDFYLMFEYAWSYTAIHNFLSKNENYSLIVSKDISPFSAAFAAVSLENNRPPSIYTSNGQALEIGIANNQKLFENIFIASEVERAYYTKLGRNTYPAISPIPKEIQVIEDKFLTVGILMGSTNSHWEVDKLVSNLLTFVEKISTTYNPNKILIRLHPNEVLIVKPIVSKFSNIFEIHENTLKNFISLIDFSFCGGTTSALEVLEHGKAVIYSPEIDCYPFPQFLSKGVLISNETLPSIQIINEHYKDEAYLSCASDLFFLMNDTETKNILKEIIYKKSKLLNDDSSFEVNL